jgi:pyruvate/2-oxoglutarate dehydrogenase complex dihydrolipoamide dehydrogenase (E3) component
VCAHHAGVIIKNVFFRLPAKLNYRSLPWVTYTDPELAQVGVTEEQARAAETEFWLSGFLIRQTIALGRKGKAKVF